MRLDVHVLGQRVGQLAREGPQHVFSYLPEVPPERFVSLTMPVRLQSYVWPELHPVFQMNLPEGYLKDALRRRFGPVATVDDMSLLALTGRRTIGRVQVVPHGTELEHAQPALDLAGLLSSRDAQRLFLEYVEQGLAEGVAGVMPKALAAVPGDHDKATVLTEDYIVKTGPRDLPGLAINEHLCLEAARRAGIEVPETRLSADGSVLAIRRFDGRTQERLGFEDFCALKGLSPYRKYEGSHEDLAKLLKTYAAAQQLGGSRDQLFRLVAFNHAVHNSDAHLKNYAMLYSSTDDARLAPAYDILTVPAYPEFHHDIPGLTLYGKKTWSCGKLLLRYAQQWLDIRAEAAKPVIEQVSDALRSAAPEVKQYADGFAEFREVGKRMLEFWDRGIIGIQPDSRASVPSLRESTGLSNPKRRRRRKRNPFRSEDGGFSHKVR